MNDTLEQIVKLERANYAAILPIAQVTPGLEIILRDDVILTSSETFPAPDTTHACLLRTTPAAAEDLVTEVGDYFQSKGLSTTIYISPACKPAEITDTLSDQGFVKQEAEEAWLILEDVPNYKPQVSIPEISISPITRENVSTFASLFLTTFNMPVDFAPYMAALLEPCVGLHGVYHYLAYKDEQPIGTCSLLCYEDMGILGSVGVLPAHRKGGTATGLAVLALNEAQEQGVDTLMVQTAAGTWIEKLLCINGFERIFVRSCYTSL